MLTMFLDNISNMLTKNFVYLGLDKKKPKKLQANLNGFIKMISYTICFYYFSLFIPTKFGLLIFKFK